MALDWNVVENVEIDLIKRFKFGQQFTNYQVKWKLPTDIGYMNFRSDPVDLYFSLSDGEKSERENLLVSVEIKQDKSSSSLCFKLCPRRIPLPAIVRLMFYQEGRGVIYNQQTTRVFHWPEVWFELDPDEVMLLKQNENLYLHVFIAIPSRVDNLPDLEEYLMDTSIRSHIQSDIDEFPQLADEFSELLKFVLGDQLEPEDEEDEDEDEDGFVPSDVKLVIVDKETGMERIFNCHSTILAARSTYFGRLFRRRRLSAKLNLDEKKEEGNVTGDGIKFDDIDEETMRAILRYIYTGKLPISINEGAGDHTLAMKITEAAMKFKLTKLMEYCLSLLMFRYTNDKMRLDQLALAKRVNIGDLEGLCKQQLALWWLCGDTKLIMDSPMSQLKEEIQPIIKTYIFDTIVFNESGWNHIVKYDE